MANAQCLENIKSKNPPVYCDSVVADYCKDIQPEINEQCEHNKLGGDTPVIQRLPGGGKCWCCCSCFAYYTQIAVKKEGEGNFQFKIIQDIARDEMVLTTDATVSGWVEKKVTELGGLAPEAQIDFMFTALFKFNNGTEVQLITTADHLFLREGAKLTPIQDLRPGDEVIAADGSKATVILLAAGQYTGGVRHIALGDYKPGDPFDGHLLNSEGLVTADLSLQLAFYGMLIDEKQLLSLSPNEAPVGSTAYLAKYGHERYLNFVNDPAQWPRHFTPVMDTLLNIPLSALSYFSKEQAEDIMENSDPQNMGDSASLATTRYLFTTYSAWYKDIYFIVDWRQELPNAYYFIDYQQRYIVLTGAMARLLYREGLSIVLSHMVAQSLGFGCTGEADYKGIQIYLREVWRDELCMDIFDAGYVQLEKLFDLINPEHQKADPDNICAYPSVDCRKEALIAGAGMRGLPDCANPKPDFGAEKVVADKDLSLLTVYFSRDVNVASGSDPYNYTITPGDVKVLKAEIDETDQNQVKLTTEGLSLAKEYTLKIKNVYSRQGSPLSPGANTVKFKTSKATGI
jgi:hypothetical protein